MRMIKDRTVWVKLAVMLLAGISFLNIAAYSPMKAYSLFVDFDNNLKESISAEISKREKEYERIRISIPDFSKVGFIGDKSNKGDYVRSLYLAKYALLPIIIERSPQHNLVIGYFPGGKPGPDFLEKYRLSFVQQFSYGMYLFRKVSE